MKLDKLTKLREHKVFRDFTWPAELDSFARLNLIYGWNGSGKTTLSELLKSLQYSRPITEGQIDFSFDGSRVSGSDLATAQLPQVRVFNRDTVSRSVFEAAGASLAQLPPVYVFGQESAEKQHQVEVLKVELQSLASALSQAVNKKGAASKALESYAIDKAREIKNLLVAPGGSFNNYNMGTLQTDILKFETNPSPALSASDRQALLDLKDAKPLLPIPVPSLNFPDVAQLHAEACEALTKTVVSGVIAELTTNASVATWIGAGLALHRHGGDATICKFCEQPLAPLRLRRLEAHFNDEFHRFADHLTSLAQRIEAAIGQLDFSSTALASALYPHLQDQYEQALTQLELHASNVRRGLRALANAVRQKQSHIFESLDLESFLTGGDGSKNQDTAFLLELMQAIAAGMPVLSAFVGRDAWARLLNVIQSHNQRTSSFAEEVKSARMRLHQHELAETLLSWQKLRSQLKDASAEQTTIETAKKDVELEIKKLEADILQHRAPADELNREIISYLGHDEIQLVTEQTGYRLTRRGTVAGNLSEGERTAIAFLYFLKSLSDRSFDLAKGIVVIDDPISSLDTNSIYSAFGFMKRRLNDVGQLFVLTHNFTFFRLVRNWFNHANLHKKKDQRPARFYMLRVSCESGARSAKIAALDPFLRDHESEYHYLFKRVLEAMQLPGNQPLQTYYELPNLARRLLESFLVFKVPDQGSLHSRLEAIDFDGAKKTRILRFVDTHSHAEQIGGGHEEASELAEAPEILRNLIELIESCDSEHATRMRNAMSA